MPGLLKKIYNRCFLTKASYELSYWKNCFHKEGGKFDNGHYARLMLAIAEEPNDDFLKDKTVADFGCGPRGSLSWAKQASQRIGIDILADMYLKCFPEELGLHNMQYVNSTEMSIPVPDESIDILYTVNALDHVANLPVMCTEIRRILKPGGLIIGSFNLNHKPTKAEPQTISEDLLRAILFNHYEILSWRISAPGVTDFRSNIYSPLYSNQLIDPNGGIAFLWAKVRKT
jgi:ubiquinone/menaquinone biosynthesis C-methylase UbiE